MAEASAAGGQWIRVIDVGRGRSKFGSQPHGAGSQEAGRVGQIAGWIWQVFLGSLSPALMQPDRVPMSWQGLRGKDRPGRKSSMPHPVFG